MDYLDATTSYVREHMYLDEYPTLEQLHFQRDYFPDEAQEYLAKHPRGHAVTGFTAKTLDLGNMMQHLKFLLIQDVYDGEKFAEMHALRNLVVEYTPHEELRHVTLKLEQLGTSCKGEIEHIKRFVNLKTLSLYLNSYDLDPTAQKYFVNLERAQLFVDIAHSLAAITALPHVPTMELQFLRVDNPPINASQVPKNMTFKNLELDERQLSMSKHNILPNWLPFCNHLTSLVIKYPVEFDIDMNWKSFVNLKNLSVQYVSLCTFFQGMEDIPNLEYLHYKTTEDMPDSFIDGVHFPNLQSLFLCDGNGIDLNVTKCKNLQTVMTKTHATYTNEELLDKYINELMEFFEIRYLCAKIEECIAPMGSFDVLRVVTFANRLEWHCCSEYATTIYHVNADYEQVGLKILGIKYEQ